MIAPTEALRRARRVILFLAVGLVIYGVARFDVVTLPEGALSPLYGIHAGDRLLVDRHTRTALPGETWLYRAGDGRLLLGRVEEPPATLSGDARARVADGGAWILAEREVPGIVDSRTSGPFAPSDLAGHVVFVLPW